jgi:hypothetical protein
VSALPAKDIERALLDKGFHFHDTHHRRFFLVVDGKRTAISTKISHGERECGASLVSVMARQVRLSRKNFLLLVKCSLTGEAYVEILRQQGDLDRSDGG